MWLTLGTPTQVPDCARLWWVLVLLDSKITVQALLVTGEGGLVSLQLLGDCVGLALASCDANGQDDLLPGADLGNVPPPESVMAGILHTNVSWAVPDCGHSDTKVDISPSPDTAAVGTCFPGDLDFTMIFQLTVVSLTICCCQVTLSKGLWLMAVD